MIEVLAGSQSIVPLDLLIPLPQQSLISRRPEAIRLGPERIEWRSNPSRWLPGANGSDCLFTFLTLG